jgi:hypothetical protein
MRSDRRRCGAHGGGSGAGSWQETMVNEEAPLRRRQNLPMENGGGNADVRSMGHLTGRRVARDWRSTQRGCRGTGLDRRQATDGGVLFLAEAMEEATAQML